MEVPNFAKKEVPNFAKKKLQIKCPACGESVIIDVDPYITEVGKKRV